MKLRTLVLASTMALGALGCSGSDDDDAKKDEGTGKTEEVLQVFSWWTGPGEAQALKALVDEYQDVYPNARFNQDADANAGTWREVLAPKIDDGLWDIFQMSASDLSGFMDDHEGSVAALDSVYEEADLAGNIIPDIENIVTRDGHPYGVVTGVHRNNSFLYNQQIFADNDLEPPTTMEEFLAVSAQLKEAGIMPVASDMDTWVLRIVFDALLAGTMGAQGFDDFIKGKASPSDPEVEAQIQSAIDTFDLVITDYVDVERSSADGYNWDSAAQDLFDGKAAMMFHGDWAKGFLVHLGWTPGIDFGVMGPPGAGDLFIYGADMLGLPTSAPHTDLAKNFLAVVASPAGQVAFNKYKGSTPMRSDVRDELDKAGQASLDGLINAKVLMPGHANSAWEAGIEAFAKDHDKAALLQVYVESEP